MNRIVFTGGPGTGKSAVLELLAEQGYHVGVDAPRSIIRERKAAGLLPRPEPQDFAGQVYEREIAAYNSPASNPAFFERGVVDAVGSLVGAGVIERSEAKHLVAEYPYDGVFIFPPWEDIYTTDDERDHSFDHVLRVHESTLNWYTEMGYTPVEVPCETPEIRSAFVINLVRGS